MARRLPSQQDTKTVERKVRGAFRALFRKRNFQTFFEHGHWWVRLPGRDEDEIYDAVDAEGIGTKNGFGFERV